MANMVRIQNAITEEDHLLNLGEPNDAFLLQHLYSGDVITEVCPADLLDSAPEARGFEIWDENPERDEDLELEFGDFLLTNWLMGGNV